jgi:hypothetical protein
MLSKKILLMTLVARYLNIINNKFPIPLKILQYKSPRQMPTMVMHKVCYIINPNHLIFLILLQVIFFDCLEY